MSSASRELSSLLVLGVPFSDEHRKRLGPYFSKITHVEKRDEQVDSSHLAEADVIFGWPVDNIQTASQVPVLKFIQLTSAGSEKALASSLWKDEASKRIQIASAAGVHTSVIPQHFIMTTLALFHHLQEQIYATYVEKRWAREQFRDLGHGQLRGQTVGFLGYGHIGREAARLSAAFGANVIAANVSGTKKSQDGYIIPGTGDPDGSIPSAWHSTVDSRSLATFLAQSDVILLSLPSTPATKHILNATTIAHLKPSVVIVNVGRGDAIETDALIAALDEGKIAGAALDVTDPEPLPDGHTLFGRPNVIITPHLSGLAKNYFDLAVDILEANIQRWKEGKDLLNIVDRARGY